jgi:hypothetical protein
MLLSAISCASSPEPPGSSWNGQRRQYRRSLARDQPYLRSQTEVAPGGQKAREPGFAAPSARQLRQGKARQAVEVISQRCQQRRREEMEGDGARDWVSRQREKRQRRFASTFSSPGQLSEDHRFAGLDGYAAKEKAGSGAGQRVFDQIEAPGGDATADQAADPPPKPARSPDPAVHPDRERQAGSPALRRRPRPARPAWERWNCESGSARAYAFDGNQLIAGRKNGNPGPGRDASRP